MCYSISNIMRSSELFYIFVDSDDDDAVDHLYLQIFVCMETTWAKRI